MYDAVLSTDEKARVHRLEILDELEEWRIIQSHYFLLWAFRTDDPPNTWKVPSSDRTLRFPDVV